MMSVSTQDFKYFDKIRDASFGGPDALPTQRPIGSIEPELLNAIYQKREDLGTSTKKLNEELATIYGEVAQLLRHTHTENLRKHDGTKIKDDMGSHIQLLGWIRTVQKSLRGLRTRLDALKKRKEGTLEKIGDALNKSLESATLSALYNKDASLGSAYAIAFRKVVGMEQAWNLHRVMAKRDEGYKEPEGPDLKEMREKWNSTELENSWKPSKSHTQTHFFQHSFQKELFFGLWGYDWRDSQEYKDLLVYIDTPGPAQVDDDGVVYGLPAARPQWKDPEASRVWISDNLLGYWTKNGKLDSIQASTDSKYLFYVTQVWDAFRRRRAIAMSLPVVWKALDDAKKAFDAHHTLHLQIEASMQTWRQVQSLIRNFHSVFTLELPQRLNELETALLNFYSNATAGNSEYLPEDLKEIQDGGLRKLTEWLEKAGSAHTKSVGTVEGYTAYHKQKRVPSASPPHPQTAMIGISHLEVAAQHTAGLQLDGSRDPNGVPFFVPGEKSLLPYDPKESHTAAGLRWLSTSASSLHDVQSGIHTFSQFDDDGAGEFLAHTFIALKESFSATPRVQAWINQIDARPGHDLSVQVAVSPASQATSKGLYLRVKSTAGCELNSVRIACIAYSDASSHIWGSLIDLNGNVPRTARWCDFPHGLFSTTPKGFIGLRSLHAKGQHPTRIEATCETLRNGVLATVGTWKDSKVVDASFEIVVMA